MAAPIALPAVVVTAAGYLAVAGGVMTAVSQITVDDAAKLAEDGGENASARRGRKTGRDPDEE